IERVDQDHANAQPLCQRMSAPEYLSPLQVEQLEAASRLVKEPLGWKYENRTVRFDVDLPPHAVVAITLELALEPSAAGEAA
ncbi:MAG: hypothetical protein LC715_09120, partial [Gammaproteobacteria bacterium]|nr:hypothetical protein [Gammaproteobacteria bacterium]